MTATKRVFSRDLFEEVPLVGILRDVSVADAEIILPLFIDAGFTTIEVPINSKDSEELINRLALHFGDRLNIGAGSVADVQDLRKALDAGASFIVTPVVVEEVIITSVGLSIPIFPGAFTTTEIWAAWRLGAAMVKVFPAKNLGIEFINALKGPMPHIKLLPTGGIDIGNATDFLKAGASGLGVSEGLFKKEFIKNRQWEVLGKHFKEFKKRIESTIGKNN